MHLEPYRSKRLCYAILGRFVSDKSVRGDTRRVDVEQRAGHRRDWCSGLSRSNLEQAARRQTKQYNAPET